MTELKKILICEDEEILLTALRFRLQKQGYELILAADGKEAKAVIDHEQLDLIITEISVPKMSGLDIIRYVRQNLRNSTPIIIIAPLEDEEAILEAMAEGGDDFVTKPFKPVELVLRIRRIFRDLALA
ncbi:MAG: response regulator transcription factor [Phaeodactylibacter sp.]|nr:response regulator transcription factor [Phaeodactylibacter sp.]MCB9275170.1 response regulator transcription factor [Lewinellaceae bacterium]